MGSKIKKRIVSLFLMNMIGVQFIPHIGYASEIILSSNQSQNIEVQHNAEVYEQPLESRKSETRPDWLLGGVYDKVPKEITFTGYLMVNTAFGDRDTYPSAIHGGRSDLILPSGLFTIYTLQDNAKFVEFPKITAPSLGKDGNLGESDVIYDTGLISYSVDGYTFQNELPSSPELIRAIRFDWGKGGHVTYPMGNFGVESITGKVVVDQSNVTAGDQATIMKNVTKGTFTKNNVEQTDLKTTNYVVKVKENQSSLEVKDSTVRVGEKWETKDNFVSATDPDGNPLSLSDLTVSGSVDTSKAGKYEVTYTNAGLSKTAVITVIGNSEDEEHDFPNDNTGQGTGDSGKNNNTTDDGMSRGLSERNKTDFYQDKLGKLPQTGELNSVNSWILGLILLASTTILFLFRKNKNNID